MREVVRTTNSSIQRSTISRLSGLLDGIRGQQKGKKRQIDKEHRIQIRWIHYDEKSQAFIPVRQKNAGGNSFVYNTIQYNVLYFERVDTWLTQ